MSTTHPQGIGADIEEVDRFRTLDRVRHVRFLSRIYTDAELDYCFSKSAPGPHLAARFAAKEAVIKALGSLGISGIFYNAIEVCRRANGAPSVCFHAPVDVKAFVSLSHAREHALAVAYVYA